MNDEIKVGQKIEGVIVLVDTNHAYVDINEHMDATITKENYTIDGVEDLTKVLSVGDSIEAQVSYIVEDVIHLIRQNMLKDKMWEEYAAFAKAKTIFKVKLSGINKGGLFTKDPFELFLPLSQIDLNRVENPQEFLNKELEVVIIDIDSKRRKATLSRREVLEAAYKKQREEDLSEVREGDILELAVSKIIPTRGLNFNYKTLHVFMPISEWAHLRTSDLSKEIKLKDKVKVIVKSVDEKKKQLIVSRKRLLPTPWEEAMKLIEVGKELDLEVVHLFEDTGALLKICEGVNGYLHQSELSFDWHKTIRNTLVVGEKKRVVVINIDEDKKRVGLSAKRLEKDPWQEVANLTVGDLVKGQVVSTRGKSASIEISPLVYARLALREATDKEGVSIADVCPIGNEIEAKIININHEAHKIELSVNKIALDEEREIYEEYLRMKENGEI